MMKNILQDKRFTFLDKIYNIKIQTYKWVLIQFIFIQIQ